MLPRHELDVPDPAPLPFAIGSFDWFGPMARAGFPHRHAFHEIVYVTRGSGSHVVDLTAHRLRPPQLFVVAPGQVHHWRDVRGLDGWVVVFTDDALLQHPADRRALAVLGASGGLRPTPGAAAELRSLLAVMAREYTDRPAGFTSVLAALLHVLVVRALRIGPASCPPPGTPDDAHGGTHDVVRGVAGGALRGTDGGTGGGARGAATGGVSGPAQGAASIAAAGALTARLGREAGIAERFGRLLTRDLTGGGDGTGDAGPAPTVRAYAARLGVSTSHLTEAVKASTGEPPGRLIRRAQALEARRLLAGTGLSVAQVAHAVGFADPAYFCRFFRREVGVSPGRFRDQHR